MVSSGLAPSTARTDMASSGLAPGITGSLIYRVRSRDLVTNLFPGSAEFTRKPAVLATGVLVALCEWPAMDALRRFISDDEDSLGTRVSISHQAPVWAGTKLTITARCASVTGRASRWDVSAYDGTRTVASGCVEFAVVRTAAFLERHLPHIPRPADSPTHRTFKYQSQQENAKGDPDLVITCGSGKSHPMVRT